MTRAFIGFDPGINYGLAVLRENGGEAFQAGKFKSLVDLENTLTNIVSSCIEHGETPIVLTCRAMGAMQVVIRKHSAMSAIMELVCEKLGAEYYEVADCTIRKQVMGKGNAKKPEVMAFLKIDNEHIADAALGAMYLRKMAVEP